MKYGIITSEPAHAMAPGAVRTVMTACKAAMTPSTWNTSTIAAMREGLSMSVRLRLAARHHNASILA
ncbi:hypothetical protein [Cupriavidus basilensis]|uniref:hypothetical protein n=1 Tax=Cupriavidus basilensis TaxID=68895 RepID=UPI001ED8DCB2|nr:hypothetical protein [Cupriavidus basilensis]